MSTESTELRTDSPSPVAIFLGGRSVKRSRGRRVVGSPSLRYFGRRLLQAIPVLWGVTFLTFTLMNILPGDAAQALLGTNATPQEVHALEIKLHLNQPFLERYVHWLGGVVTGNLGSSLASGQTVTSILVQRLPVSAEIVFVAFLIAFCFSVPTAILCARHPGGLIDRLSMGFSMLSLSIAGFVLAIVLVLVFAVKLGWLPAIGWVSLTHNLGGNLRSVILPSVSIAIPIFGVYTRLLRGDIIDEMLGKDYVLTARAKGASPWRVLSRHALKNAFFPLLTLIGLNLGTLIGGTVIVEEIFAIPGIGSALLQAINDRDVPVVEGTVLIFATLVVLSNLLTDMLYSFLDPRVRYGSASN